MTDTMIKRIALAIRDRAIEEREGDSDLLGEFGGYADDSDFVALAHAVLAAIREPTGAVLVSGIGPLNRRGGALPASDTLGEIWRTQIDALLAEGENQTFPSVKCLHCGRVYSQEHAFLHGHCFHKVAEGA